MLQNDDIDVFTWFQPGTFSGHGAGWLSGVAKRKVQPKAIWTHENKSNFQKTIFMLSMIYKNYIKIKLYHGVLGIRGLR